MNNIQTGKILAAAVLIALAWPWAAKAAVAFEQDPANGNDAYSSISAEQSADNFTLPSSLPVDGFSWWGSYLVDPSGLPADQFQVRLFQDNGAGKPLAAAFTNLAGSPTRTAIGLLDATGATVYRYDLSLASPVALNGGTTYYLSVVNGFDVSNPSANWYWLLSNSPGSNFYRFAEGESWQSSNTGNLAFNITTAVPIPAAIWLWLSGMGMLGTFGGKKQRKLYR